MNQPKLIGGYQRLTIEDIESRVTAIANAVKDQDFDLAHSLEDGLYLLVLQKLAYRGSRIAAAALESRNIEFVRYCG